MPQLSELPAAPATVEDGEMFYVRSPSQTPPSRRRFVSELVSYILGPSPTTPRGFFGATPVVRPSGVNQGAVSGTAGASYTSNEQAIINDLIAKVNAQRAALVALGLIKGGA
jgi:hypothetical protein